MEPNYKLWQRQPSKSTLLNITNILIITRTNYNESNNSINMLGVITPLFMEVEHLNDLKKKLITLFYLWCQNTEEKLTKFNLFYWLKLRRQQIKHYYIFFSDDKYENILKFFHNF